MRCYPSIEIGVPEETHTVPVTVVDVSVEVVPPFCTPLLGPTSVILQADYCGNKILRNVGNVLPFDAASSSRRLLSETCKNFSYSQELSCNKMAANGRFLCICELLYVVVYVVGIMTSILAHPCNFFYYEKRNTGPFILHTFCSNY